MKHFWKKTNRGLWLGAVLLVITLIAMIVPSVMFSAEKPLIRDTVKDYVNDLITLNLSPESAVVGKKLSDADRNAKSAELETLLRQYWDPEDKSARMGASIEDVRGAYASFLNASLQTRIIEGNVSISDRDIYITRQGPGYASVSVSINTLSVTYEGTPDGIFIGEEVYMYPQADKGTYIGSYSMQLNLEMHRVDGEWRIISSYGYVYEEHAVKEGGGMA